MTRISVQPTTAPVESCTMMRWVPAAVFAGIVVVTDPSVLTRSQLPRFTGTERIHTETKRPAYWVPTSMLMVPPAV